MCVHFEKEGRAKLYSSVNILLASSVQQMDRHSPKGLRDDEYEAGTKIVIARSEATTQSIDSAFAFAFLQVNRHSPKGGLRSRVLLLFYWGLSNLCSINTYKGFRIMPKQIKVAQKSLEELLWDSANKLRGTVVSYDYMNVCLGLIFLKYAGDRFDARRAELIAMGREKYIDHPAFYMSENVFYLTPVSRWSYLIENAKKPDLPLLIDTALAEIEKNNDALKGALPDNFYSRLTMDVSKLAALVDIINQIKIDAHDFDLFGRVYEYFLGKFAASQGQKGGEYYTPKCIVRLLTEMIDPYKGRVYDPCCGSGGMFVQSAKFIEAHGGETNDIAIFGQEQNSATLKLAKMNLAIRGISADFGAMPADTFSKDQHKDLKADFILANPPFNLKEWRAESELTDDPRWNGFDVPPVGNANYGWILHMLSKLSDKGVAGFVMANGSMSSSTGGEDKIRRALIEKGLVECMIALPSQLFFTVQIPACLWFIRKNRDRKETLFIDARNVGFMADRTHRDFSDADIAKITATYHNWRKKSSEYQDVKGFCKSADLAEIAANDYVLTPGRYVGIEEQADDGEPFDAKMTRLTAELSGLFAQSDALQSDIRDKLASIGWKV